MTDFLFDGPGRLIIEPPGVSVADVERDIYSAWKRWVLEDGAVYPPAFTIEGGTPIGDTGVSTGVTFIMINGWRIRLDERDHETTFTGNFYSDDGIYTVPTLGGYTAVPIFQQALQAQVVEVSTGGISQANIDEIVGRLATQIPERIVHTDWDNP